MAFNVSLNQINSRKRLTSLAFITKMNNILDYLPFGMRMSTRSSNSSTYRFGFNGKGSDDEIKGFGNSYNFGAGIYNPRVARFLSVDSYWDKNSFLFSENTICKDYSKFYTKERIFV